MNGAMSRKLATLLAFIMLVNIFGSTVGVKTAYAAGVALALETGSLLRYGDINDIPVVVNAVAPGERLVLSWDFSDTTGKYTLKYPISDNTVALLEVNRDYTDATVDFKLVDGAGAAKPGTGVKDNFAVYSHIVAAVSKEGDDPFVRASEYIDKYNPSDTFCVTTSTAANFKINRGNGFSFRYNDGQTYTMSFLWTGNTFYFETDSVKLGNLYNFNLQSVGGTNNRSFFPGISTDDLVAVPTANNGMTSAQVIDISLKTVSPPGSDVAGINFGIPLPKQWDTSTYTFTSSVSVSMPLRLMLGWDNNNELGDSILLFVDNINSDNPQISSERLGSGSGNVSISGGTLNKADGMYYFELEGLEKSTIFNRSWIRTYGDTPTRQVDVPFGKIFTFMEYTVVSVGGKYYISFKPYKGENLHGQYLLRMGYDKDSLPTDEAAVRESDGSGKSLLFPLSLNEINLERQYFQLFFKPGGKFANNNVKDAIYSQVAAYQATASALGLSEPTFFDVTAYSLNAKDGIIDGSKANLDMSVRFDMGLVSIIDKLIDQTGSYEIQYRLDKTLTPLNSSPLYSPMQFAGFTLELADGGTGLPVGTIVDGGGTVSAGSFVLERALDSNTGFMHYYARLSFTLDAEYGEDQQMNGLFYYPNVYFINITPVLGGGYPTGLMGTAYDTISLSNFTVPDVAPPQNMKPDSPVTTSVEQGDTKDETSFKISWDMPSSKLHEYVNSFSFPAASATAVVNLYISQSEPAMKSLYTVKPEDRKDGLEMAVFDSASGSVMYFSEINGASAMAMEASVYKDARAALRQNKIVCVSDIALDATDMRDMLVNGDSLHLAYTLDGLDKNQRYYVYADIAVTLNYLDSGGDEQSYRRLSPLSALAGITTSSDKVAPKPEEKIPPAPTLTVISSTMDSATLGWDNVSGLNETVEYEIIRLQGEQMPTGYLNMQDDFNTFWNTYLTSITAKAGFGTSGSEVRVYNGSSFVTDSAYSYVYVPTGAQIKYTDQGIVPNHLYFYYVRAVKKVNGAIVSYSVWSRATVTSKPVGQPENLKVEQDRTNYDRQTEAYISFDAPLSNASQLGSDYILQYQLKEDGKDWMDPKDMDSTALKASATTMTSGMSHFIYKITGLKAGTSYTVRVRMLYRDKKDNSLHASLYSNSAVIRTDLDQGDYDDQDTTNVWTNYFRDEIQKLLKDPYWTVVDSKSQLEVVYRPSMFGSLISQTADGSVTLYGKSATKSVYYIPASSMMAANGSTKALRLVLGDLELIIPPSAIDMNLNSSVIDINAKIKDGTIKDYYIKLNIALNPVNGTIDGNTPLGDQISVTFSLVGITKTTAAFENELLKKLTQLVSDAAADASTIDMIKDKVTDSTSDENMIKYISGLVSELRADLIEAAEEAHSKAVKATYAVYGLNKSVIIVIKPASDNQAVSGYEYSANMWIAKETVNYGNGRAIYVQQGTYAFAGRSVVIFALGGMKDAAAISAIITKYGLEDYLGSMSVVNVEQAATRDMLIGIVARIAGAPRAANPTEWLSQNKKLVVSSRNSQSQLQTQEALYLLMSLYEFKTGTKVSQMQVRNYAVTANVQNLDDKYKAHVRAAYEIGLYAEKSLQPAAGMKIKDILNMLGTLDKKVKL